MNPDSRFPYGLLCTRATACRKSEESRPAVLGEIMGLPAGFGAEEKERKGERVCCSTRWMS